MKPDSGAAPNGDIAFLLSERLLEMVHFSLTCHLPRSLRLLIVLVVVSQRGLSVLHVYVHVRVVNQRDLSLLRVHVRVRVVNQRDLSLFHVCVVNQRAFSWTEMVR